MDTNVYKKAAQKYRPLNIRRLFIAESPPHKKEDEELRYFYFEKVKGKDFLFRNLTMVLFPKEHEIHKEDENKKYLLNKLKNNGDFLIDACEYPINQLQLAKRNKIIETESKNLIKRLKNLVTKDTEIILIKKNIYGILAQKLKDTNTGFNVLNKEFIDFPSQGNQKKFRDKLKDLLQ